MSEESEWKDVNPVTADLPIKGRIIILLIAGGLALGILGFLGVRVRPLGLAVGAFSLFTGIGMVTRAVKRRISANIKPGAMIAAAGFLMLLANPRFGLVASFATYFLIVGAIILVVTGISKAIKMAWDLGKRA